MTIVTHELIFHGELLNRGFWLYVWEITTPQGTKLHYVGRTGDSSSFNAQSPFNRMSQHLGFNENSNVLRHRLDEKGVHAEKCVFRLVAHGPILPEATTREEHRQRRDCVAAMERALADAMLAAGYNVINPIHCRTRLDERLFTAVRSAFADWFPRLVNVLNPQPVVKGANT